MARRVRPRRVSTVNDGIPPEFRDQLHPIWRDPDALAERFPELVDAGALGRAAMGARVYHLVVGAWCVANGFESERFPASPDWRAFRAAMGADH